MVRQLVQLNGSDGPSLVKHEQFRHIFSGTGKPSNETFYTKT